MHMPTTAGHVGVPKAGEQKCPVCGGYGQDATLEGCDQCDATGVVANPITTPHYRPCEAGMKSNRRNES